MSDYQPVRVVSVRDPSHTIRFPGRANADRWLEYRTRELWRIEPIEEGDGPWGPMGGNPALSTGTV